MSYTIHQNTEKFIILANILYLLFTCFLRDIHEGYLLLKDADDEQKKKVCL